MYTNEQVGHMANPGRQGGLKREVHGTWTSSFLSLSFPFGSRGRPLPAATRHRVH